MLVKIVLSVLPSRYRLLLEMGLRIGRNVNSKDEIKAVLTELDAITKDGRVSVSDWSRLGKVLKVYE